MITENNIQIYGNPIDTGAMEQMRRCMEHEQAAFGVLCADHHKGYSMPIGGVIAYDGAISPSGVGYDIGCGNKAVRLDVPVRYVKDNIVTIMDDVFSKLEFGVGRRNITTVDDELFDSEVWRHPALSGNRDKARGQLGTIGSGNHYVDIFEDEQHRVWVGVHFGSRGLGHGVATWFLKACGAVDNMDSYPTVLGADTTLGGEYLQCMELAGKYAYAGRNWVCNQMSEMLGGNILEEVHNHHNYAWLETHGDKQYYVVRKGATPAFPGQKGFVGGSMGDCAVILEGVESEESGSALYSTVHGAGRVMSRTQAAGKKNWKTGERITEGQITPTMMQDWVRDFGVELRGADTDEAPQAYKRLPDVLKEHEGTIRILHTLRPLGVAMAGKNTFDPFKD